MRKKSQLFYLTDKVKLFVKNFAIVNGDIE